MHFWRWGEYGGICVGVRVDAKVRSQTQAPFGEAYQGSWWPFNHYKPRIRLCFLPETEGALRSHQECCLSASQCCHIDFHLYQNYGFCIVFPILLVTWPHCDVAIPFAFTPGNPIWEDFSFIKSPPQPNLHNLVPKWQGRTRRRIFVTKDDLQTSSRHSAERVLCFSGASSTEVYPFPYPPDPWHRDVPEGSGGTRE